jgi:DNA-binding GntR family transcriptional regulator
VETTRVASAVRGGAAPPETVTEFVTEKIRDRIVLGALQPGQKLSVYDLALELGVSRVPLREAVRQLEAESLVDNLPRKGTVVRPLTFEDVSDAFEILDKIEVIAARRAAISGDGSTAKEMRYWLDQMQALSDRGVSPISEEMLHAHRAFHFALFNGSGGGGVLGRHLCMLWNTCERYVINSRTPERQASAAAEHRLIVERIEAMDPDGTAEVLQKHIDAALAGTMTYLASQGISPVASR